MTFKASFSTPFATIAVDDEKGQIDPTQPVAVASPSLTAAAVAVAAGYAQPTAPKPTVNEHIARMCRAVGLTLAQVREHGPLAWNVCPDIDKIEKATNERERGK